MSAIFALTFKQPWASIILFGGKNVENRSWPVPSTLGMFHQGHWHDLGLGASGGYRRNYDGLRIGIHAGKGWDDGARLRVMDARRFGLPTDPDDLPRGALLGFVTVTGCHHANECTTKSCEHSGFDEHKHCFAPCGPERRCSPWAEDGVWHWTLADPQPLDEPILMRGRQKLWRLPEGYASVD